MSFLEINTTPSTQETVSCTMDRGCSNRGSARQPRCNRRELWNRERLHLLRRAQDNAARKRQQAELRRLTDKLLAALAHLEGPLPPEWTTTSPHRRSPPARGYATTNTNTITATAAAAAAPAAAVPPPPARTSTSWVRDQLDLLADLDLIEH